MANAFEDLSGISNGGSTPLSNPYDALLLACNNDPKKLQDRYTTHRTARNSQQKAKMLAQDFPGVKIDPILLRQFDPSIEPGYVDPRNCLVFWARPTEKVKDLIGRVQKELTTVAPNLWLMPRPNLHMTALEMTHSKTPPEISSMVTKMAPTIPKICDYTYEARARLIKPMIGFDDSAIALSFVPAAGEMQGWERTAKDDEFSYHHLRRNLYELCQSTGVAVDSRYVVPSSHLTIGRFIYTKDFEDEAGAFDREKMEAFIRKIEEINEWLRAEFWPEHNEGRVKDGGEWVVGQEKGLNCRSGTLWYGDGDEVVLGKGF